MAEPVAIEHGPGRADGAVAPADVATSIRTRSESAGPT